jgi:RNA polymerase sigma-70 factor, ECF subfamily
MASASDVTVLLNEWQQGDESAVDRLFPLVYNEMRRIARAQRRGSAPATLNTTALIHEAYLKLVRADDLAVNDRAHFMSVAARAMRQILINYVTHQRRVKRGGGLQAATLLDDRSAAEDTPIDLLLSINAALEKLSAKNPRMGQVVECRFFAGMSVEETSIAVGAPVRTIEREWARARVYLTALLEDDDGGSFSTASV